MKNKTITVITRDRAGLLSEVAGILAEKGVNLESISLNTKARKAVIHITTSSLQRAKKALRSKGFEPLDANLLVLTLKDKAGELARAAALLQEKGVRVKRLHLVSKGNGRAVMAFETSDNARARRILRAFN